MIHYRPSATEYDTEKTVVWVSVSYATEKEKVMLKKEDVWYNPVEQCMV